MPNLTSLKKGITSFLSGGFDIAKTLYQKSVIAQEQLGRFQREQMVGLSHPEIRQKLIAKQPLTPEEENIVNQTTIIDPSSMMMGELAKVPLHASKIVVEAAKRGLKNKALEQVLKNSSKFAKDLSAKFGDDFAQETLLTAGKDTIKKLLKDDPKALSEFGIKSRGFIESVKSSPATTKEVRQSIRGLYEILPNPNTVIQAKNLIDTNLDEAIRIAKAPEKATALSNTIAQELMIKFQAEKRFQDAIDIAEITAQKATDQGQAIQALSLYGNLTPEGILRYAQRIISQGGEKLTEKIAQDLVAQAEKIQTLPNGREKIVETAKMLQTIFNQVPSSVLQKISSAQTFAQLLNPKTAIRNIVGNVGFAGLENVSDVVGAAIDTPLSFITGKRAKVMPSLGIQFQGFRKGFAEGVEDVFNGINTSYIPSQYDLPQTPIFKGGVGKTLEKLLNLELRATDRAFYQAAKDGSLYNQMKAAKVTEPTQEMLEIAHYDGLYRTFQDDNLISQFFTKLKKGLNIGKAFGLGDIVLKYPKTPGNLLARGIEYSPGGFVYVLVEAIKPLIGKPFNQKAFVESFSRAITGTSGLVGMGALLKRIGIITGKKEEDKDVRAVKATTGLGQYRINVSAMKRFVMSGFNAEVAKLQEGDRLISYDWFQPQAIALSIGANLDEGDGATGVISSALSSINEGLNTLAEQPLISGLRRVMLAKDFSSTIKEIFKGVPASFVPTILNQINQLIDNTQRNTYSPDIVQYALNLAKAKIPGLAQTLPPRISVWGEEMERYQGESNNFFNVLFNPAFVSKYAETPEAKMVLDLFEQTGEATQFPRLIGSTQKINGENIKLTPTQVTAMQRYAGRVTKELFASFAADDNFKNLAPEAKIKYLSGILTDVGSAAKIIILGNRPKRVDKRTQQIIKLYR